MIGWPVNTPLLLGLVLAIDLTSRASPRSRSVWRCGPAADLAAGVISWSLL
jgi:hypothetical protein